jgi:hypothetical protein
MTRFLMTPLVRPLVPAVVALACLASVACDAARRPGGSGTPGTPSGRDASTRDLGAPQPFDAGVDADADADAEPADLEDAAAEGADRPSSFDARPAPDATFPDAFVPSDVGFPGFPDAMPRDAGFPDAMPRDASFPDAATRDAGPSGGDAGTSAGGPVLIVDRAELVAVGAELDVILEGRIEFNHAGPPQTVFVLAAEARLNAIVGTMTVQQMTLAPSSFVVPTGPSQVAFAKIAGSPRFPSTNCLIGLVLIDVLISLSSGDQLTTLLPVNCPP